MSLPGKVSKAGQRFQRVALVVGGFNDGDSLVHLSLHLETFAFLLERLRRTFATHFGEISRGNFFGGKKCFVSNVVKGCVTKSVFDRKVALGCD